MGFKVTAETVKAEENLPLRWLTASTGAETMGFNGAEQFVSTFFFK